MSPATIKYAIRSLARARGFTLAVILTLGLGIGANTAIFSVVRGVLLRPLPHEDGDRLVYLRHSMDGPGGENILFSVPEINDFRASSRALAGLAEYSPMTYTLRGDNDAVRMTVGLVTGNYFQVMGLAPILGRALTPLDDGTQAAPVMVLTHDYWTRRFRGDSGVVGDTVLLDGRNVAVVGVLQPSPTFPARFDALMNMVISEHHTSALMNQGRTHRMTEVVARLAPDATVEQARTEVTGITQRVMLEYASDYDAASNPKVEVKPFQEVMGEQARQTLYLLMAAAAFVMIISCANVANLGLMRVVRREHELVVRAALGAGAARLRHLLLAENLVLATAGAVLGLVLAKGGLGLLISLAERYSPRANEISLDGMVLGFTLLLTLAVALILTYAPRLAKEGSLGTLITAGTTRTAGSIRKQRLQRALVVAQVAVSVMLLTGAGLLVRTMQRLAEVDDGLRQQEVLTMEVPIGFGDLAKDSANKLMYERMRFELGALPGVRDVAIGSTMPLRSTPFQLEVKAEGRAANPNEPMPRAEYRTASPEYFRAAGIPLMRGREFQSTDRQGSGWVVVINKTLADHLFPDRDPVGQRIAWTGDVLRFIPVTGEWRTVVGVVADTKDGGLDAEPRGVVFMPFLQEYTFGGGLVINAQADAAGLAPAALRILRGITPTDPIENVLTVDQIRDESVAPRRLNAALLTSFSALAVLIAAVGIAGVLAFSVSTRTNEIGIRMSLGASTGMVQRMILSEGGILLGLGLVLGVAGALLTARLIRGMLFGVEPHDPATLVATASLMAVVGIVACWLPAVRAARVDPIEAIRAQ